MDRETHSVVPQDDGTFVVVEDRRGQRRVLAAFPTRAQAEVEARERDRLTEASIRAVNLYQRIGGITMTDGHPKRPRDPAQLAKLIVDIATGQVEDREPTPEEQGKDPAAVALGRRGGVKGGKARADKLTPDQRTEAARRAALSRWGRGTN